MSKLTNLLDAGEEIVLYHSGFTVVISPSSEGGFNGDIYNSIFTLDNIPDTDPLDGGLCDSSSEDAIDFFTELVNDHINRKDS